MQWQLFVVLPQKAHLANGLFDETDQTLVVMIRPHYLNYIFDLPQEKVKHFQWLLGLELNKKTEIKMLNSFLVAVTILQKSDEILLIEYIINNAPHAA